jgi:hypothetical protein
MEEIARLRRLLLSEQRRREEAEGQALSEQRRREEAEGQALSEQRRREEEQRRREEEQRRREEEQRRREEEQRRREEAEGQALAAQELAKPSQPQTLQQYLEACHSLSLAIQVVTNRTLSTQGEPTKPAGRIYPRRIIPWNDFATKQEEIWDQLLIGHSFYSQPIFPSSHQLEYVMSRIRPISSEIRLRDFERNTVEDAVQELIDKTHSDLSLQSHLGLQGTVTFESHTNLGKTDVGKTDNAISESIEHMSIDEDDTRAAASVLKSLAPKTRRKARGKGNLADQFCIYRMSDGRNVPILAIEYKAPHKLSQDEIITGLESEIQPERDVINKDGKSFDLPAHVFASRSLTAAVITQLFSYMIGKGIRYGYVCTGEAFVFLYIPDDPTIVYYSVCVPNLDVLDDDETRLHRTAVAQVFAFTLQALRAGPPPLSWHDGVADLKTWAVEYDDVLRNIPATVRKEPRASPYKPQRWQGFKRSPIRTRTRSRCQQPDSNTRHWDNDNNEKEDPPSPTPNQSHYSSGKTIASSRGTGLSRKRGQHSRGGGRQQGQATQQKIQDRAFCTQQCLLGLAYGGPMDENCPNFDDHGQEHIDRLEFLQLIREQLAVDRGPNADSVPLYLSGSVGSVFKVRLSSHGYTVVAKGMESLDFARLRHENELYDQLRAIQGKHVPVCLGRVDLVLPYYYDSGVYVHFLFLSWAGRPLFDCINQVDKAGVIRAVTTAFTELHRLHVLHCDAEPRNILYNAYSGNLMIVDFERAEFQGRQPLGSIGSNAQNRRRKRKTSQKRGNDVFARELRSVVECVSRWSFAAPRCSARG